MKIVVALFVYNERRYLPYFMKYYTRQGCNFVVVDNYSTDGTYEYLKRMGANVVRCNTNDSFQLRTLQDALTEQIAKAKPEWVVYTGADLYYAFDASISRIIKQAHIEGYNQISVQCASAMNTGEEFHPDLVKTYHYGLFNKPLTMISRHMPGFYIIADELKIPKPNVKIVPGVMINYGACKPIEEQKIKLQRRQKAWDEGMHKGWGVHYLQHQERQWIWKKEELKYFPETHIWKYIKRI